MNKSPSLENWAVYAHKDDTGLGRMASDIKSVLGLERHLVIPSERLNDYPVDGTTEKWLANNASEELVRTLLAEIDGLIFFERHTWNPHVLGIARELGVPTVCIPMWEWFKGNANEWSNCDLFICPSLFTQKVIQSYGFKNTCHLSWPIDLSKLPNRHIQGPARHFVHNAGLVDQDDRKGTRDTIRAFCSLKRNDIRLTVRMQKDTDLPSIDQRVEIIIGNLEKISELYSIGDVCVQPSKMEGIGFMVLEPVCSGMPVLTTNYPPMNEYIQQSEMRCRTHWFKRKAYATQWIKHAHLKKPKVKDLAERMEWAASTDMSPISLMNRQWAENKFNPDTLKRQWTEILLNLYSMRKNDL